jgi:hypothetical protein
MTTPAGSNYNEAKRVFGASLEGRMRSTGRDIPQCIANAMAEVAARSSESEGLFRKPGILSRIQKLQDAMESNPGI